METLTENEYKMIEYYQRTKNVNVSLYFFNKFRVDLVDIVFSKINKKFSSIPYEKGDLIHLVWVGILKTLKQYKKEQNFQAILIRNCYITTIKEVKKFINNKELVMNISSSDEQLSYRLFSRNEIEKFEYDRNLILKNVIELACEYIKKFPQKNIKRIIYLKSMGYSVNEIAKKIKKSRYYVDHLIKLVKKIINKFYL